MLELDTWPADILDQFVRRARAVAGADATLTADQVAGLSTSAANGELNTRTGWLHPARDRCRRPQSHAGRRTLTSPATPWFPSGCGAGN